jgi:hypothetical protein
LTVLTRCSRDRQIRSFDSQIFDHAVPSQKKIASSMSSYLWDSLRWSHSLPYQTICNVFLSLFLGIPLLVFIRAILFITTHVICERGVWLFPNLLSDPTFLGGFFPLYGWDDNPKESLKVRWARFKNLMLVEVGMLKSKTRKRRVLSGRRKSKSRRA